MKKIIRLTESDLARIVKRVINEELNDNGDQKLLDQACMTWKRWKGISTPEDIKKAKEWTKTVTGVKYPFDMDVACASKALDSIRSEEDRKVLRGVINLDWIEN